MTPSPKSPPERAPGSPGRQEAGHQDTARRSGAGALVLPAVLAALIALLGLTPRVQVSDVLTRSFLAASAFLFGWTCVVAALGRARGRAPALESSLRAQHYIQACCQVAVFAYWGWYWRPVYDMAVLFAAQVAFAYAFSMLLAFSRGVPYRLGFGPIPIIFSINLFLWFRDDWFYLQFLMIGVGFLGKEFVRWEREGRRVHVFNPSAFALGLFSLVLIATGTTDLTWGREIASTLTLAPHIYLYLFLVGLVVMHFFSITLIAGTAALVLFSSSAVFSAATGVPYFIDSEIPAAVFLGLHLLVTDPSTSPRTPAGKVIFGGLYGVGVFALYTLLGAAGVPTFYDKLLCVPLLNLSVRGIDGLVASRGWLSGWAAAAVVESGPAGAATAGPAPGSSGPRAAGPSTAGWRDRLLVPVGRPNLAHMAVWILFFTAMTAIGRTDGFHPGDSVPFWVQACAEDRPTACERLLSIESTYCRDNSAWACNELGAYYAEGRVTEANPTLSRTFFARACELQYQPACVNLLEPGSNRRTDPRPLDLRLLLREGGLNLMQAPESELLERACRHEWRFACEMRAGTG